MGWKFPQSHKLMHVSSSSSFWLIQMHTHTRTHTFLPLHDWSFEITLGLTAAAFHNFSPWTGKAHQIGVFRYHADLGIYVATTTPQCPTKYFPYCFSIVKQCHYPVLLNLLKNKEHKELICTNSSCLERKQYKTISIMISCCYSYTVFHHFQNVLCLPFSSRQEFLILYFLWFFFAFCITFLRKDINRMFLFRDFYNVIFNNLLLVINTSSRATKWRALLDCLFWPGCSRHFDSVRY